MDILIELKRDHDRIRHLFERLKETTERAVQTRHRAFAALDSLVRAHSRGEEQSLYPRMAECRACGDSRPMVLEGVEEHRIAERLLDELRGLPVEDEHWTAKLKALADSLEHHLEEEEEELFVEARELLGAPERAELCELFRREKGEVLEELEGEAAHSADSALASHGVVI